MKFYGSDFGVLVPRYLQSVYILNYGFDSGIETATAQIDLEVLSRSSLKKLVTAIGVNWDSEAVH